MRLKVLFLIVIVCSLLVPFSFATLLDPPSFDNHQFEGSVIWDASKYPGPLNVLAKINGKEFVSHLIYPQNCGTKCQGTYGKDVSNILLVSGTAGAQVQFYVDNTYVRSYPYAVDGFTTLDLDISTPVTSQDQPATPPANNTIIDQTNNTNATNPPACAEDWRCGNWSNCVNGIKLRTCTDLKKCNATNWVKNATIACIVTTIQNVTCRQDWQCNDWSACRNGQEQRTCLRVDDCDLKLASRQVDEIISIPKPLEARVCAEQSSTPAQVINSNVQQPVSPLATCSDGLLNQNEEEIDCGGVCSSCKNTQLMFYLVPLGVLVLIGILVFFFIGRTPSLAPEQMQQLYNYFQSSQRQGFNKEQITNSLVQSGWKKKVIKKFIRKSQM